MKKIFIIILYSQLNLFAMHNFYTNFNTQDIEIRTDFDIAQYTDKIKLEKFYLGGRILYFTDKYSSDEPELYSEINFHFNYKSKEYKNLNIALGAKLNHSSIKDKTITSIPLSMSVKYNIKDFLYPFTVEINGAISPSILTFEDGLNFYEYGANISFPIIEDIDFNCGVRNINTNYIDNNVILNKSFYIGTKIKF